MNVLLIGTKTPPFNGQSIAFEQLIDGLKSKQELQISVLPLPVGNFSILFVFHTIIYLTKLIFTIPEVDLVYLQTAQSFKGLLRDAPAVLLGKLLGKSVFVHCHGGNYDRLFANQGQLSSKLASLVYKKVDSIIVLSDNLHQMFSHDFDMLKKCYTIPNGLAMELPDLKEKRLGAVVRLLFLSNLHKEKGYEDVLQAMLILKTQNNVSFELHIAGDFATTASGLLDKGRFHKYLYKHQLSNVVYHGVKTGNEKWKLISECDIFILPTYYRNEGQPISIIEAMAHGLPVITTHYRGIPSLIEDGVSGLFVEVKNPQAIADSVLHLVSTPEHFDNIRKNAYHYCCHNLTGEVHVNALYDLLIKHSSTEKN